MENAMNRRQLESLGIPRDAMNQAFEVVRRLTGIGIPVQAVREALAQVNADPASYKDHPDYAHFARRLVNLSTARAGYRARAEPAQYQVWGSGFEPASLEQMKNACKLPVAWRGALMPDAHVGYGLPIGGVLATRNAVIPYAVGVDIACRMKLTVLDLPPSLLESNQARLRDAIVRETRFGIGAEFRDRREHRVMDEDWAVTPVTAGLKDKAWAQLGTSGSGNHFVEFGTLTLERADLGLEPGIYLALLSHSGSRGTGAQVADHYSKRAKAAHEELPPELSRLAWLDLDSDDGRAYWHAMELMGKYAAANHELIHRHIASHLGAEVILDIENHHNFAWKETHDGKEVIVHRKGATPAGSGVLGIIPGSMGSPGFVVRGKGDPRALDSASHGAGRAMSRTAARAKFNWQDVRRFLTERNVSLISAGLDEVPMAYKDIHEVMAAQNDLVEVCARFDPRLVKMAESGERPED
jgi:tRNA-splicing ligase RtcB (3'-phosphate/5'-hydroxy nucleic acid ligase)